MRRKLPSLDEISKRMEEQDLYDQVAQELEKGEKHSGLWLKAITLSKGDTNRAEAAYVELRIQSIIDEAVIAEKELNEANRRKMQWEFVEQRLKEHEQEREKIEQKEKLLKSQIVPAIELLKELNLEVIEKDGQYIIHRDGAIKASGISIEKVIEFSNQPSKIL